MPKRRPPDVAVTGTGRCGTAYTALLLGSSGLDASHEAFWHPRPRKWGRVDVSALATLHLPMSIPVLHIVRHPLETLSSFHSGGMFTGGMYARSKEAQYIRDRWPQVIADGVSPAAKAARMWVLWNRRIETQSINGKSRYRLARIETLSVSDLMWVASHLGVTISDLYLAKQIEKIPTDMNSRPRTAQLTWDELRATPWGDEFMLMAERYGYA